MSKIQGSRIAAVGLRSRRVCAELALHPIASDILIPSLPIIPKGLRPKARGCEGTELPREPAAGIDLPRKRLWPWASPHTPPSASPPRPAPRGAAALDCRQPAAAFPMQPAARARNKGDA